MSEPFDPSDPADPSDKADPSDQIDRLADAIDAYLARTPSEDTVAASAYLEQHPHLREFLEPMLEADADEAAIPATAAPARIGPYRILREIGRGGMGIVYEAEHEQLARRAALKVLPELLSLSPRRIRRFLREAKSAARLEHPGLARVLEVGEVSGTWWFAMELVEGETLGERLRKAAEMARVHPSEARLWIEGCESRYEDAAEVGRQLADALEHAHAHGLVHRDVKPQNVLLDDAGKVRLVDFGLAKDLGEHSLTGTGDFMGTPHYCAPEMADRRPDQDVDGRADLFAVGCVLYEMVAMRRPFDGGSTESILHAVLTVEPRALTAIDAAVPRDLQTIIARALEKEPARRYQTAADLREDLRRFLDGEPIRSRPRGVCSRALRWARRRPWAAFALLLAFLLFVVTPITAAVVLEREGARLERERDAARRNFAAANRAVDQLFVRIADSPMVGDVRLQRFRRGLLEDARRFYLEFLALVEGDVADGLREEVALATGRIAVVDYELARYQEAAQGFTAAIEQLERRGADPDDSLELAEFVASRGQALELLGRDDEAKQDFERAERLWALVREPAGRQRAGVRLVRLRVGRANRLRLTDPDEALAQLEAALASITSLRAAGVETVMMALDECAAETYRASLLLRRGQLDEARASLQRARELRRDNPDLPRTRGLEGTIERVQAQLAERSGDRAQAERLYRRAIDRLTETLRWQPDAVGTRYDRAQTYDMLARSLAARGRFDESLDVARLGVDDAEWLLQNGEIGPLHRRVIANVLSSAATAATFTDREDVEVIDDWFERSVALQRELIAHEPDSTAIRGTLGGTLNNQAMRYVRRAPKDRERAVALLEQAVELQRVAFAANPGVRLYRVYLFNHLTMLGPNRFLLGDRDGAIAAFEEAAPLASGEPARLRQVAGAICGLLRGLVDPARRERALEVALGALEAAAAVDPQLVEQLATDARFALVHEHPRFRALLR
ncbi:MAG: protein kinase domain-containing protein [Planctomycetota bacterium]